MNVNADGISASSLPPRTWLQIMSLAASLEENPRTERVDLCWRSFAVSLVSSLFDGIRPRDIPLIIAQARDFVVSTPAKALCLGVGVGCVYRIPEVFPQLVDLLVTGLGWSLRFMLCMASVSALSFDYSLSLSK